MARSRAMARGPRRGTAAAGRPGLVPHWPRKTRPGAPAPHPERMIPMNAAAYPEEPLGPCWFIRSGGEGEVKAG